MINGVTAHINDIAIEMPNASGLKAYNIKFTTNMFKRGSLLQFKTPFKDLASLNWVTSKEEAQAR